MTILRSVAVLLLLTTSTAANAQQEAPAAIVETLTTRALHDYPGKEAVVC